MYKFIDYIIYIKKGFDMNKFLLEFFIIDFLFGNENKKRGLLYMITEFISLIIMLFVYIGIFIFLIMFLWILIFG